jgi:hypothetical protein
MFFPAGSPAARDRRMDCRATAHLEKEVIFVPYQHIGE